MHSPWRGSRTCGRSGRSGWREGERIGESQTGLPSRRQVLTLEGEMVGNESVGAPGGTAAGWPACGGHRSPPCPAWTGCLGVLVLGAG